VADPPPPLGDPLQGGLDQVLGLVPVAGQQVRGAEQPGGPGGHELPELHLGLGVHPTSSSSGKTGRAGRHDATPPET
jgi:hypothetical protein